MVLLYDASAYTGFQETNFQESFDENITMNAEIQLNDDLMALAIGLELDITIATASEPLHHGVSAIIGEIDAKIDGSDQRISLSGYEAVQQTVMYTQNPPINMQVGAVGANQKLLLGLLLPCQILKERGKTLKVKVRTVDELKLDDTAGNITINDALTIAEIGGVFGNIKDETWLVDGSKAIASSREEITIAGADKFIENVTLRPDPEVAAALYDVIERITCLIGKRVLYESNKTLAAIFGALSGSRYIANDEYLGATVYTPFQDDFISRGLLIPLPTTKQTADLIVRLTRTTSDNVFWSALQSMPVEGRGEETLEKKATASSTKQQVA